MYPSLMGYSGCLYGELITRLIFFFFQAEDGIRDLYVTGVQTCALPIYVHSNPVSPVETKEVIRPLSDSKRQLATAVAEQVGLALANLKLRETLRLLSVRDPLTGLFNRRFMQESLERELRRAARSSRPLGGILLDIDHFKQFNDSYSHEAGDIVLRELGGFLQSQIRGEDIACRVGGEEFLLILPDTSLDVTRQRAEKLREASKRVSIDR